MAEFKPCGVEYIAEHIKLYLDFVSFHKTGMFLLLKCLPTENNQPI